MDLVSYGFLLLFLPISLLLYWKVFKNSVLKLWLLGAASLLFYALAGLQFLPWLLGLSVITYWLGLQKRFTLGIIVNVLVLVFFKYWFFGATRFNTITFNLGLPELLPQFRPVLPLGISFFTFKHIGYLFDVRQKRYPATRDFLAFATFSAFFPQISAGPISSFGDTGEQLRALPSRLNSDQVYQGLTHLSMGLAKKILIADVLAVSLLPPINLAYGLPDSGLFGSWFALMVAGLQLYFDFSGYTDIALGVGYLFGITLPPNFNSPVLVANPREFWERWHISLATWFRFYVFFPLSRGLLRRWGARRSEAAQFVSNLVTMLLLGFWHGPGWQFLVWGAYNGVLLNVYAWGNRRKIAIGPRVLAPLLFILAMLPGMAFFAGSDLISSGQILANLFGLKGLGQASIVLGLYGTETLITALVAFLIAISGIAEAANLPKMRRFTFGLFFGIITVLCLIRLGEPVVFAYVQF